MVKSVLFFLILFSFMMQIPLCFSEDTSHPVRIIFDTDMGSDCDDVGALALLHHYANIGEAEIVACVYSSGKVPYGAGVVQAINNYYGRPTIPVGAYQKDDVGDPVDKMSAEKLAKDTAAFGHSIIHNQDAPDQTKLCRTLLAEQEDHSVTYITVGHTKGLYDLMTSSPDEASPLNGLELVQKKVKRWVALGALQALNDKNHFTKDWNFFFNETAPYTKYLVENFPAPVFYISAGSNVMTGKPLQFTPPGNIVRTAYRDWLWWHEKRTFDDQRPSWDLAAVYFAVEGLGEFLTSAGPGRLEFDTEQGCRWLPANQKTNQTYIQQKTGVELHMAGYLNHCISLPPQQPVE